MHQPYTAPTLNSTRPATGFHTSPRPSSIHKPIHQRHSPPISTSIRPTNQSTNDTVHQISTSIRPTNQSTNDHRRTNQTTDTTLHKYHHTHSTNTTTIQFHKHIQPPQTHTAPTNAQRHRRPLDAAQATVDVDVDADDVPTLMQHRCSRSPIPVRNWTGQTDRIRPYKTRPDRIRPPIHN